MRFFVVPLLATILFLNTSYGQEAFKRKTIYGEFLGAGGLASINFDYRFGKNPEGFGIRTGIGYFQWNNSSLVSIPVIGNYLLGKNGKYLDLGIGARIGYETMVYEEPINPDQHFEEGFRVGAPILNIGYRYQPLKGGFNFRAGFSPYIDFYTNGGSVFFGCHTSLSAIHFNHTLICPLPFITHL